MRRLLTAFFCVVLIPNASFSNELSGGGGNITNQTAPSSGLDFSNVTPRENVDQCSEADLQARQEQQNQCVQSFGEMGITQTIKPHEVIEAQSCEQIERFTEYLSGCAQFFLDMPGDTLGGIASLFGAGQYEEQIQNQCGDRPTAPLGASRRQARHGRVNAQEQASLDAHAGRLATYNTCANGIRERGEQAEAAHEATMEGYRSACRATAAPRRLARHGDRVIKGCMLERAGRDGCEACIAELNQVPISTSIVRSVLDEFKKYRGFACYNKETQGRMVCAAIATAAGLPLGGAAASLAGRLPAAFRSAQAVARGNVSRMTAAADAVEDAADASSSIAAVQAGRVTEETLAANGALNNADRAAEAQRLLGGQPLTSQQQSAVIRAHEVGADRPGSGYGNYTQAELREKNRILREAGFDTNQRRELMDQGIVGRVPEAVASNTGGGLNDDLTIGQLANRLERANGNPRASYYDRDNTYQGVTWQRNPAVRSEVAGEVRSHLDAGGVMPNRQQRDELLRVVALETVESTRGGLMPDYNRLATYYERAGRPIDDSFVSYLSAPVTQSQLNDTFFMQARLVESRMATQRLRAQAAAYNNDMTARGLDMTPAEGRARASEIMRQVNEIERMSNIIQSRIP